MAVIVSDAFVEGSNTTLDNHTPGTGSQWLEVVILGTTELQVEASTDWLRSSGSATGNGQFCRSQPSPSTVDYDVELEVIGVDTGSSTRVWRIHGRATDGDNTYMVELLPTGHTDNDVTLFKIVGGTKTQLATVDTGLAANDVIKLELRDAAKKVYKDGAEILSSADNALTSAGDAGVSCGKYSTATNGNTNSSVWAFDNYVVTEVDASSEEDTTFTAAASFFNPTDVDTSFTAAASFVVVSEEDTAYTVQASFKVERILTFESGNLTGTADSANSSTGTVTLDSAGKLKGDDSFRIATVDSSLTANINNQNEVYASIYVYVTALPGSSSQRLLRLFNSGAAWTNAYLALTSTGKIQLLNSGASQVGSDSSLTLVAGKIYRLALHWIKSTGSDGVLEGFVAEQNEAFGVAFASTSSHTDTIQCANVQIGEVGGSGTGFSGYFDHIEVDNLDFQDDMLLEDVNSHFLAGASFYATEDTEFTARSSWRTLYTDTAFLAQASFTGITVVESSFVARASFTTTVAVTTISNFLDPKIALSSNYSVFITDPYGRRMYAVDNWLALSYSRVVNEISPLTLILPDTFPINIFVRHARIEVWRSIGGGPEYLETHTPWLVQKITFSRDANGARVFIVEAASANVILHSRLIAYNSTSAQAAKTDQADDMMKAIVRENLGSTASDTARRISTTYFDVQGDQALGPSFSKNFARRYVDETLKEIADTSYQEDSTKPIYFDVVAPNSSAYLEFRTYYKVRGTDRRMGQQNAVILGPDFGSIGEYGLTIDWSNEITYGYAGGQGEEDTRLVGTYENTGRSTISPFARSELWIDSRTYSAITGLSQEAKAAVRANRAKVIFNGKVVNIPGCLYGRHWFWGDFVTVQAEGYAIDCRINGISITIDQNRQENIDAYARTDAA